MKKLRSKKGFTLAEMLISVLLLGFVSVMVTVMTSAILNSTVTMQEVAQAEILGSEALDNLQWQLRVAQNVVVTKKEEATENDEVASDSVTFDIDSANKDCTFDIQDGKIVIVHKIGDDEKSDLLFAGSTYGNLSITSLKFVGDKDKGTIEISVEVSFGEKPLWTGSVSVKPLNGLTVTPLNPS